MENPLLCGEVQMGIEAVRKKNFKFLHGGEAIILCSVGQGLVS